MRGLDFNPFKVEVNNGKPLVFTGGFIFRNLYYNRCHKKMFCPCQADTLELFGYMNDYSKKKGGTKHHLDDLTYVFSNLVV